MSPNYLSDKARLTPRPANAAAKLRRSTDDLTPRWETSSSDSTADTSSAEPFTLVKQLTGCKWTPGQLFALRWLAEEFHGYTAGHFVTTVVAALLLAVGLLVL